MTWVPAAGNVEDAFRIFRFLVLYAVLNQKIEKKRSVSDFDPTLNHGAWGENEMYQRLRYQPTGINLKKNEKIALVNHLILIITLFWALPPPLWHPPVAIVPYYLYAIVEKFPV